MLSLRLCNIFVFFSFKYIGNLYEINILNPNIYAVFRQAKKHKDCFGLSGNPYCYRFFGDI